MRWFFPSWNGDLRIESDEKKPEQCVLTMIEPTPAELDLLAKFEAQFKERGWTKGKLWKGGAFRSKKTQTARVKAPLAEVAPVVAAEYATGRETLSAILFKDGKVEVVEGDKISKETAEKAEKEGKAAATTKTPTRCCPECEPGAVEPASEVLLSFLTPEQHATWAKHRFIVVQGGVTGHQYMLAHRHTPLAVANTRMCRDLTDDAVMHFHDVSVPPEEEVLAAKLALEHREHWLRNEATCLMSLSSGDYGSGGHRDQLKNPFGGLEDGTGDAAILQGIGAAASLLAGADDRMVESLIYQVSALLDPPSVVAVEFAPNPISVPAPVTPIYAPVD